MAEPLPTILIAAAEDEALQAINAEFPHSLFVPLATRSWAQIEASLGDLPLVAAVVHHALLDVSSLTFCTRLRALPGRSSLPIVLLLPGVGRKPTSGEPFSVAMRFPAGSGVLADNLAKVVSEQDERLGQAVNSLKEEIRQRMKDVDKQSYFEVLDIPVRASREQVVAAYDAFSLRFHPDRLKRLRSDSEIAEQAHAFYLLVSEAYQTLLDPIKRRRYTEGLKSGKSRYDPSMYQTVDDLSQITQVENAKRYLRLAQRELDRGDKKAALVFLKMARAVDPSNRQIARRMQRIMAGQ